MDLSEKEFMNGLMRYLKSSDDFSDSKMITRLVIVNKDKMAISDFDDPLIKDQMNLKYSWIHGITFIKALGMITYDDVKV